MRHHYMAAWLYTYTYIYNVRYYIPYEILLCIYKMEPTEEKLRIAQLKWHAEKESEYYVRSVHCVATGNACAKLKEEMREENLMPLCQKITTTTTTTTTTINAI